MFRIIILLSALTLNGFCSTQQSQRKQAWPASTTATAVDVSTYPATLDQLPIVVRTDAKAFYDAMFKPLTSWASDENKTISNWSKFFIHVLFKNDMSLTTKPVIVEQQVTLHLACPSTHRFFDILMGTNTEKSVKKTDWSDIFDKKLQSCAALKALPKANIYKLFMHGFIDRVRGARKNDTALERQGFVKLICSGYGMCQQTLSLLEKGFPQYPKLSPSATKKVAERKDLAKHDKPLIFILENKIFEHSPAFLSAIAFTEKETAELNDCLAFYFNNFMGTYFSKPDVIDTVYMALPAEQQSYYKDLTTQLTSIMIVKQNNAQAFGKVWLCKGIASSVLAFSVPATLMGAASSSTGGDSFTCDF